MKHLEDLELLYQNKIINHSVSRVCRCFSDTYLISDIPNNMVHEESDGFIYIEFSSGILLSMSACTEEYSIIIKKINEKDLPSDNRNFIDTTGSPFWLKRKNKIITNLEWIEGYRGYFGVLFTLSDLSTFSIYYESQNEYVFDAIIIRNSYPHYGKQISFKY